MPAQQNAIDWVALTTDIYFLAVWQTTHWSYRVSPQRRLFLLAVGEMTINQYVAHESLQDSRSIVPGH